MSGSWMRRFGQGFKLENEIKGKSMIGIYIYIYIYILFLEFKRAMRPRPKSLCKLRPN